MVVYIDNGLVGEDTFRNYLVIRHGFLEPSRISKGSRVALEKSREVEVAIDPDAARDGVVVFQVVVGFALDLNFTGVGGKVSG